MIYKVSISGNKRTWNLVETYALYLDIDAPNEREGRIQARQLVEVNTDFNIEFITPLSGATPCLRERVRCLGPTEYSIHAYTLKPEEVGICHSWRPGKYLRDRVPRWNHHCRCRDQISRRRPPWDDYVILITLYRWQYWSCQKRSITHVPKTTSWWNSFLSFLKQADPYLCWTLALALIRGKLESMAFSVMQNSTKSTKNTELQFKIF